MNEIEKISMNGVYSTDMRDKPISIKSYYQVITKINKQSNEYFNVATLGFYKVGQLLNRAKKELLTDFGKLKKELAEDGLHEKAQERYMKIARNENIQLNYSKLPPQWTLWERLADLPDDEFDIVQPLLRKDITWNELLAHIPRLNKTQQTISASATIPKNQNDNRYEIFGMELRAVDATKSSVNEFNRLTKDIEKLAEKYSDIVILKQKNFYDEASRFLNNTTTPDDTSSKDVKKYEKSYSTSKKKGF
tara:strand:- start:83 stop:829 length:747 start_codon:yes stop_codon:yes gene_type:complete